MSWTITQPKATTQPKQVNVAGQNFTYAGAGANGTQRFTDAKGVTHTVTKDQALGYGLGQNDANQFFGAAQPQKQITPAPASNGYNLPNLAGQSANVGGQQFTFQGGNQWKDASGQTHTVNKSDAMGYGLSAADAQKFYGADTYQPGQNAGSGANAALWQQRFNAHAQQTGMGMPNLSDPAFAWLLKHDDPLAAWNTYQLGKYNNTAVNPQGLASYYQNQQRIGADNGGMAGVGARTPQQQAQHNAELAYYAGITPTGQQTPGWTNPNQLPSGAIDPTRTFNLSGQQFTFLGMNPDGTARFADQSGTVHSVTRADAARYGLDQNSINRFYSTPQPTNPIVQIQPTNPNPTPAPNPVGWGGGSGQTGGGTGQIGGSNNQGTAPYLVTPRTFGMGSAQGYGDVAKRRGWGGVYLA